MGRPQVLHRPQGDWRRRHLLAALRLRPPIAQHSLAEADLLREHARGARLILEIGVAEGASALELREVMDPAGALVLVDPYDPGPLGLSLSEIVARRTVAHADRGTVTWIRAPSAAAAANWDGEIDFLFIDGDHSVAEVRRDWELWAPRVRVGGHVALHDARVAPGGWDDDREWISGTAGPVLVVDSLREDPRWEIAGEADTTVVLRRCAA